MWPKLKKSKMIRFLVAVSTLFYQILRVPEIKLKKKKLLKGLILQEKREISLNCYISRNIVIAMNGFQLLAYGWHAGNLN